MLRKVPGVILRWGHNIVQPASRVSNTLDKQDSSCFSGASIRGYKFWVELRTKLFGTLLSPFRKVIVTAGRSFMW